MKKGKGKAAKKAMKFADRKAKAEKWVTEYDGTAYGGDIIKAYRKKFAVDRMKAVEELQLLGVPLTKEQIDREKAAVKAYQDIQKAKKAKRKRQYQEHSQKAAEERKQQMELLYKKQSVAGLQVNDSVIWDNGRLKRGVQADFCRLF